MTKVHEIRRSILVRMRAVCALPSAESLARCTLGSCREREREEKKQISRVRQMCTCRLLTYSVTLISDAECRMPNIEKRRENKLQ